jgi:hypothetical protein
MDSWKDELLVDSKAASSAAWLASLMAVSWVSLKGDMTADLKGEKSVAL